MLGGYMGKFLWVDLTEGTIREETPDEDLLREMHKKEIDLNDAASLALLLYRDSRNNIRKTIEQGEHGRYLSSIGFASDVALASEIDSISVLPVLKDGRLILEENQ